MRKLLFIVLVMVGCTSSDENVVPDVGRTSLTGDWLISGDVTGKFTLIRVGGRLVALGHGYYDVEGTRYEVSVKRDVEETPDSQITIFLVVDSENYLVLRYCSQDLVGFKSIDPEITDFYGGGGVHKTYLDVKVTR